MDDSALFNTVRSILIARTGKGLSVAEFNDIKRALVRMMEVASPSGSGRGISKRGIDLIHSFESFKPKAYKDPGSINGLPITIGWGSTSDLQGKPIKMGDVWTRAYGDAKFAQDIAVRELQLNTLLGGKPTTQNQFDALMSFAYNVGMDLDKDGKAEGLGDSTLLKKHLAGDYAGAQAEFAKWNKNDGKVMAGLTRRRAEEAALYGEH